MNFRNLIIKTLGWNNQYSIAAMSYGVSFSAVTVASIYNYDKIWLNSLTSGIISYASGLSLKWSSIVSGITLCDDLITATGITKNHYLSNIMSSVGLLYGFSDLNPLDDLYSLSCYGFSSLATAAITYYFNYDIVNSWRKSTSSVYDNYYQLKELFFEDDLHYSLNKFILTTIFINIGQKLFDYYSNSGIFDQLRQWHNVNMINPNNDINLDGILINYFTYGLGTTIASYFSSYVINSYYHKMSNDMNQQILSKVLNEENIFKISYRNDTLYLMQNLHKSSLNVAKYSATNFIDGIGQIFSGLIAIQYFSYQYFPIFLLMNSFEGIFNVIFDLMEKRNEETFNECEKIYRTIDYQIADISHNMRSIVERDGVNYMQNSLADGLEKLYQANISAASANAELSTMQKSEQLFCHFISSVIADYWFFTQNHGNQNYAEKAAQNQKMKYSIDQLLSFLQWSHNDLSEYKSSIQKLQNIIDMINRPLNSDFIATSHNKNALDISEIELKIGQKTLVKQTKIIEIPQGKIVELHGQSGCGKSTLLTLIKGIANIPFINSSGTVCYPEHDNTAIKSIMITQSDYMITQSSLLEVIAFPAFLDENKKSFFEITAYKILAQLEGRDYLNREENIDDNSSILNRLNEVQQDWSQSLSGGQRKKVIFSSALLQMMSKNIDDMIESSGHNIEKYEEILNNFLNSPHNISPAILIFDEIWNGLDGKSSFYIMKTIKKYLGDSIVISVDHNAKEHNKIMQDIVGEDFFDLTLAITKESDLVLNHFGTDQEYVIA